MTLKDGYGFGGFSGTPPPPPVGTKSEYPPPRGGGVNLLLGIDRDHTHNPKANLLAHDITNNIIIIIMLIRSVLVLPILGLGSMGVMRIITKSNRSFKKVIIHLRYNKSYKYCASGNQYT